MLQKIIVSNCASENFFELLDKNSICYIKSLNNEKFNNNYNDHIDLSILKIDNDIYIENSVFEYYKDFLKDYNLIKVDFSDFKNGETVLNVAKNDKYFFHNEKFTTNCINSFNRITPLIVNNAPRTSQSLSLIIYDINFTLQPFSVCNIK